MRRGEISPENAAVFSSSDQYDISVTFSLIGNNTYHLQLKEGKDTFDSLFLKFQYMFGRLKQFSTCLAGLNMAGGPGWMEVAHHRSQEAKKGGFQKGDVLL